MSVKQIRIGRLEIMAFVSGFALMVFELAGARVLAPDIGSSTYVWTSVIGVIIAALSLGYWVGGKLADKRGYPVDLARLALLVALTILVTTTTYQEALQATIDIADDPRLQGVLASLVLFAPTSFLLGMISPYLAKLKVRSLATTGRSIASLSALNSIGGIVGTFTAGFVLFGYVGAHETFVIVGVSMVVLSWLFAPSYQSRCRVAASVILVGAYALTAVPSDSSTISIDTPSAHYSVFDASLDGERIRAITSGPGGVQSGISLDRPNELVFWYTKQLAAIVAAHQERGRILVLGGGTFTLPQYLADKYPNSTIDVVEIDPELVTIAKQYFKYQNPSNVTIITSDARTYVNQSIKQYDIVLVDVYSDTSVPFSLMTREYGQRLNALIAPGGVVGVNMVAGRQTGCKELLSALDAPYRAHFPYRSYRMEHPNHPRSNIVTSYSRHNLEWPGSAPLRLPGQSPHYTDNYTPADRLQQECYKYRTL